MNNKIYKELMNLAKYQTSFRKTALINAAKNIKDYPIEIKSGKDALKIKGVGKGIAKKIDIILKDIPFEIEDKRKIIASFKDIWGVGEVKANELYNKGYISIKDIPISELNSQQRIGLKYYHSFQEPIYYKDVKKLDQKLKKVLKGKKYIIAGSYRRKKEYSGDIDILTTLDIDIIYEILLKNGIITNEILSKGKVVMMGVILINNKKYNFK